MNGVIYARYSSEKQKEESIEGQLRECKAFAKRKDIHIVDTYIDRALSAKTDNRPSFQKMIKDSVKKSYDVIIVWKLDRFARNRYDSAHYKSVLRKNGVKVVSATETISEGAEGILLESLLEGMAEYYSAELSEKVVRGLTENALKCLYIAVMISHCNNHDPDFLFSLAFLKFHLDAAIQPNVMYTPYIPAESDGKFYPGKNARIRFAFYRGS